jgi:hypothetical protein
MALSSMPLGINQKLLDSRAPVSSWFTKAELSKLLGSREKAPACALWVLCMLSMPGTGSGTLDTLEQGLCSE